VEEQRTDVRVFILGIQCMKQVKHAVSYSLKNILTAQEYEMVRAVAARNRAEHQLPVIAWAMALVSLDQLDALLESQEPSPELT
jgi:hypothetical protein